MLWRVSLVNFVNGAAMPPRADEWEPGPTLVRDDATLALAISSGLRSAFRYKWTLIVERA